jgi:hypothetical protein
VLDNTIRESLSQRSLIGLGWCRLERIQLAHGEPRLRKVLETSRAARLCRSSRFFTLREAKGLGRSLKGGERPLAEWQKGARMRAHKG